MFIGVQQRRSGHRSASVVIEGKAYAWGIYRSTCGLIDAYENVKRDARLWTVTPKEELKSIYLIPFQFTEGASNE